MIDSKHHVELNGVLYRLAEDAEGDHYELHGEPLRPPNAVMVQGEGRQDKFQARPDMLLWNITDWSGGEGQIRFNAQESNRHFILHKVDPFSRPGTLSMGVASEVLEDSAGVALSEELVLVRSGSDLYGLSLDTANQYYTWNTSTNKWNAFATWAGGPAAVPTPGGVAGDDTWLWWHETGTSNIWRGNSGSAATFSTTLVPSDDPETQVEELGDYVYVLSGGKGTIHEILKTGTPPVTPIEIWSGNEWLGMGSTTDSKWGMMAKGPNRLYVLLVSQTGESNILEVVPTSAAGPGFAREIAHFPGFTGTALWYHSGTLFIGGTQEEGDLTERTILYLIPDGDYGTLGKVRQPEIQSLEGVIRGSDQASLLLSPFVLAESATDEATLWMIDTVSGGMAMLGETGYAGSAFRVVEYNNQIFVGQDAKAYRFFANQYDTGGYFISPWHDMGLSDEKVLSSVILSCEALPADWQVDLSFAVDGSTSFTAIGSYATTAGTGTKYQISTDTSTSKFRLLQIKAVFTYTGEGYPDTLNPVIHGIEVRAQVAKPQKVWRLLLDLSDDHSGGAQNLRGSEKTTNITTAGDSELVVDYKDGYQSRLPDSYLQYDILLDRYVINLDRPGEGVAYVELREVV